MELNPGPELDALVAEKVMGWKKVPGSPPFYRGIEWIWDKREACLYWEVQECPKYSTDIKAAWEVFSLPHFDGFDLGRRASDGKYEISNPYVQYEGRCVIAAGESAPHAICLAALKI